MAAQLDIACDFISSTAANAWSKSMMKARILKHPTADDLLEQKLNSMEAPKQLKHQPPVLPRKECICAPTSHPGSFRCRFHRTASHNSPAGAPSDLRNPFSSTKKAVMVVGGGDQGQVRMSRFAPRVQPDGGQSGDGDTGECF